MLRKERVLLPFFVGRGGKIRPFSKSQHHPFSDAAKKKGQVLSCTFESLRPEKREEERKREGQDSTAIRVFFLLERDIFPTYSPRKEKERC